MDTRREPSLSPPARGAIVAARLGDGPAPAGSSVVVFGPDGSSRRPPAFGTKGAAGATIGRNETAWWFDGGPHAVLLVPFVAAPETGLRVDFVIDAADPRLARQRFDLFLFSEVAGSGATLALADCAARMEDALRAALAQGTLDLPPCTSLDEWHAFRGGLDELLYMRFGVTVDDCVPVALDDVDYAAMLRARSLAPVGNTAVPLPAPVHAAVPEQSPDDAAALRRLFLEVPAASAALRAVPAAAFATRQAHLQRLALVALDVNTMPSLAWAAPDRRRMADEQRRLAGASAAAVHALDELWALLAHAKVAGCGDDEVDRVVANLECHLAARRGRVLAVTGHSTP